MQQTLVKALQLRQLKSNKGESKIKKGDGMIKKLFGASNSNKQQTSMS